MGCAMSTVSAPFFKQKLYSKPTDQKAYLYGKSEYPI